MNAVHVPGLKDIALGDDYQAYAAVAPGAFDIVTEASGERSFWFKCPRAVQVDRADPASTNDGKPAVVGFRRQHGRADPEPIGRSQRLLAWLAQGRGVGTVTANRQRGSLLLDLLPWVIGAAVVVAILYGAYRWVDNTWQTSAGVSEGRRLEHADMQPQLDACNTNLADAKVKMAVQSASIAAAASAAKASQAEGRRLAEAARAAQVDTRTEIQRLGDKIAQGSKASTCPAGAALATVREGLK